MLNYFTQSKLLTLFLIASLLIMLRPSPLQAQNRDQIRPRAMHDVLFTFDENDIRFSAPGVHGSHDLAWGDMDGDGDLDLAVANGADNTELQSSVNRIYKNEGEYNFIVEDLDVGNHSYSTSISWGDADGDGDLDLAIGNLDSANRLYLNEGRGNFTAQDLPGEVRQTRSIAWGDANGDGDLDLAVGNVGAANQLLVNDGQGSFVAENINQEQLDTYTVAWGDSDNDGDLDLAVGNSGAINQLFVNDGAGNFTVQLLGTDQLLGGNTQDTRSIAWGDMDRDNRLDLVIGNAMGTSRIFINQGNNLFEAQNLVGAPSTAAGGYHPDNISCEFMTIATTSNSQVTDITLADIDGDSDLDIVMATADGPLRIWLNSQLERVSETLTELKPWLELPLVTIMCRTTQIQASQVFDPSLIFEDGSKLLQADTQTLAALEFLVYNFDTSDDRGSRATAIADIDNDGDLDVADGNDGVNRIFANEFSDKFTVHTLDAEALVADVAWGDVDQDGDMDLAVARTNATNQIYHNDGNGMFSVTELDTFNLTTQALAWGDMDNDGDLDLATANREHLNRLYRNDGNAIFVPIEIGAERLNSSSVDWGDVDRDGDLDLLMGNLAGVDQIYRNEGDGKFVVVALNDEVLETSGVAWGDMDNDGDLDVAIATLGSAEPNYVYRSEDGNAFIPLSLANSAARVTSVAWGDGDNDGDLDLIFGNLDSVNQFYQNDGEGNFAHRLLPQTPESTTDVAWVEIDGDGDLDLLSGDSGFPKLYENRAGTFINHRLSTLSPDEGHELHGFKTFDGADMDNDGDLDFVIGTMPQGPASDYPNQVGLHLFENVRQGHRDLPNHSPTLTIERPIIAPSTNAYIPTQLVTNTIIPIPFTLYDRESDPVARIEVFYSLNDGTGWHPAIPTYETPTTNLSTRPEGEGYLFEWDTFTSGFFGQSDNVVLRMIAYEQHQEAAAEGTVHYMNSTPGPFQRPASIALTEPFRVRGTQIQVSDANGPVSDAIVYRLQVGDGDECGSEGKGYVIADSTTATPYQTEMDGYLQGRGQIALDDCLVALYPIEKQPKYIVYQTNASPIHSGLTSFVVERPGVQELNVLDNNYLIIFDLDISLEWDASQETEYLNELEENLRHTSELLFDWSNGQVALGALTIYQNKGQWRDADIRVYASNALRPHATIGGSLESIEIELAIVNGEPITNVYGPGTAEMGAIWNRFNEPGVQQNHDWSSALAHELGHYLFALYDNYIGFENDQIVPVFGCPGGMSNPYEEDDSEFHPPLEWEENCSETLSHQRLGRSDWESITKRYHWLQPPDGSIDDTSNVGPDNLPIEVTKIIYAATEGSRALEIPIYSLYYENSQPYQAGPNARAILFKSDRLLDLGVPNTTITAHGREVGDGICVYELDAQPDPLIGCEVVSAGDNEIVMKAVPQWQPDLTITPITVTLETTQLRIRLANIDAASAPKVRVYPKDNLPGQALPPIVELAPNGDGSYSADLTLGPLETEAYIHLFDGNNPYGSRNIIADYTIGGEPVFLFGNDNVMAFTDGATLVTTNGDTLQLGEGDILSLSDGNVLIRFADGSVQTLSSGDTLSLSDGDTLSLSDGDTLSLSDGDTLSLSDGDVLVTINGETLSLSDGDTLSLSDGDALVLTGGIATIWRENGQTLSLSDGDTLSLSDGDTLSLSDGDTLSLSDGDTLSLSDGDVRVIGLGDVPGIGNAPLRSNDNQVEIAVPRSTFEAGQFYIVQSTAVLPDTPSWLTPLGKAYRIESSPNAPDLTQASMSIGYPGRAIDNDKEQLIRLYYWADDSWQTAPLKNVDTERNEVLATPQGPGIYLLMYSILEKPLGVGWRFFTYPPNANDSPIAEALASIEGSYATIYQYNDSSGTPLEWWRFYHPDVPAWANTFTMATPGQSYIISMTQASTLTIGGSSAVQTRAQPRVGLDIFDRPSSFYGVVNEDLNLAAGMAVEAMIDDTVCGRTEIKEHAGQSVYSITIVGNATISGCGIDGASVDIVSGDQTLSSGIWRAGSVQSLTSNLTELPEPQITNTPDPTATSTATATSTQDVTNTPFPTHTHTPLPTETVSPTPTSTALPTDTSVPPTATRTPLPTNTLLSTETASLVPTATPTVTGTNTPNATSTLLATSTPIAASTDTPIGTPTLPMITSTPRPTEAASPVPTATPTVTSTDMPTDTPIPPTATNMPLPTETVTLVPTFTLTVTSTDIPTATPIPPTPTSTLLPTESATLVPTATSTVTSTPTSTVTPTSIPVPTSTFTATSTVTPTGTPIPPTATSVPLATETDTPAPTATPAVANTDVPEGTESTGTTEDDPRTDPPTPSASPEPTGTPLPTSIPSSLKTFLPFVSR